MAPRSHLGVPVNRRQFRTYRVHLGSLLSRRINVRAKLAGLAIAIVGIGLAAPSPAAAVKCSGYRYDSGGGARSGYPNDPLFRWRD